MNGPVYGFGGDRMRLKSLLASVAVLLPAAAAGQAPVPLDRRTPVDRAIASGQTYVATLALREGESADLIVLQQGIDLVVELVAPAGRLVDSVDSPNGRQGEEPLTVEAAAAGDYLIRIRPISAEEPAGRFTLRVAAFRDRAATARLAAERRRARDQASAWLARDSAPLPATGIVPADAALAPFDRLAAEASIVGLGEASHGSRELNDVRLSLVKRLVQRHGYRLIAVESSASRWRDIEPLVAGDVAGVAVDSEEIWIGRRILLELLNWAERWNRAHPRDRVRIVGVDPQDNRSARERLDAFLERAYGPEFAAAWSPASAELAAADEQTRVFGNSDVSAPVRQLVFEVHARLAGDAALLGERFGAAAVRDALTTARELVQFADFNSGVPLARSRDWYMAANLLAAMREHSAAPKTVYWAHNSHVAAAATRWGPTGALLRQAVGCSYRAVAVTFGRGAFLAQLPGDPEHRLLVSTLGEPADETIESVLAGTGPGARLAAWGCGDGAAPPPPWLLEPRPLRWIGGLYAPDTLPGATYRPYRLTEAFDGIAYFPAVAAEDAPADRPIVPPRPRPPPPAQ